MAGRTDRDGSQIDNDARANPPATELVIFDCDGVLVDSEPIAMRILLEIIAEAGLRMHPDEAHAAFLGRSVAAISGILRDDYGVLLPEQWPDGMRHRLYEAFRQELQAIDGIHDVVESLTVPFCVASSSQPERVRLSLDMAGLLDRFEPNIFSSTMVRQGKPAPDLFLYAADRMGAKPENCLVVEDSPAGIQAARSAGMRVCAFTGGSHAVGEKYLNALTALEPHFRLSDMRGLPALIGASAADHA